MCHRIAREMPAEDVAKEMVIDSLLTREQWETYTAKTEEREEYLVDCLQKCKPGFLDKFLSILRRVGAHNLEKDITNHKEGTHYIIMGHLFIISCFNM